MKFYSKVLTVLFFLVLAVPVLAATVEIPITGLETTWVEAALSVFGIGLVYVVNYVKGLLNWSDKKAVILTIGFSVLAAAVTLLLKGSFTLAHLGIYSLAVLGEMTAWFKLVAKTTTSA